MCINVCKGNCLVFYSTRPQINTCLLMASTFPESSLLVSWFNHERYINNATHYEGVCINDSNPSCFPDPSMTVRADITGRYSNRLYAYEPADMKLCKSESCFNAKNKLLHVTRLTASLVWFVSTVLSNMQRALKFLKTELWTQKPSRKDITSLRVTITLSFVYWRHETHCKALYKICSLSRLLR